jgi:hypothetical protein
MIPSTQEIVYRVFGAWRLARFDANGKQYFEESRRAALRSFFAAALVVPAYFIAQLLSISRADVATDEDPLVVALVFALGYCLLWVVPPVIIYRVCQVIDREKAFFRFLSANNWSSVIALHLQLAVTVLAASGIVPEALAPLLGLGVFAYLLTYQWFISRHCLDISPLAAVGFVALHAILGVLIESISIGIVLQPAG